MSRGRPCCYGHGVDGDCGVAALSRRYSDGELAAVFDSTGEFVATGSRDDTAYLWNVSTGQIVNIFSGHIAAVEAVAFSFDGGALLTASGDNSMRLWEISTGRPLRKLLGHEGAVCAAQFSPDGKTIATISADRTAKLWDTTVTLSVGPREFVGHNGLVRNAAFSPDDSLVVSAGEDREPRLWDVAIGDEVNRRRPCVEQAGRLPSPPRPFVPLSVPDLRHLLGRLIWLFLPTRALVFA